ncbi:S26 family signal peptidase [Parabacteroides sp. FAFU027]|uniref:S26 family signal peptidase n=1 Tax=Parabacteroides sp. FAFU027 TaxID=2922715 RepID=UPI001FAEC0AA|nr:S26 family signal peptidase [Parabacteroides sp. FAFU027]
MKKFAPKQWIKFIVAAVLLILFADWVGNFWILLLLPVIFDIYLSKRVNYGFWKKWENKTARKVMEWVDAILFALVAVYFINTFFFQNYKIPSSSLEKTLLVGDFLFVSKVSYGARVPNTPLSFPLAQHTLPILDCKSYIEWPQWEYKRLSGFGTVKRYDIVVFNFPAGDTVALKVQNPDIYSSYYTEGDRQLQSMGQPFVKDSMNHNAYANKCIAIGRELVKANQGTYGEIVYRPVDRRENYVKRCVGLPGDVLQIVNNQLFINQKKMANPEHLQFNYFVKTDGASLSEEYLRSLGISKDDIQLYEAGDWQRQLGIEPDANGQFTQLYHFPLTQEVLGKLKQNKSVVKVIIEPDLMGGPVYPLNGFKVWSRDNYGPLWIPQKGKTLKLSLYNLPIYERCIRDYERNKLEVKDGKIMINGKITDRYTFKMDYYWMMGDNRHMSADSRYWGFVPEDHVVGKPILIWLSLDKDRGLFDGGIRFKRLFNVVHN